MQQRFPSFGNTASDVFRQANSAKDHAFANSESGPSLDHDDGGVLQCECDAHHLALRGSSATQYRSDNGVD